MITRLTCFLRTPLVLIVFCLISFQNIGLGQGYKRMPIQHILKTPFFGLVNPFYPEFQVGYGFQKADKWAIHLTGGLVYGWGTLNENPETYTKYGGRGSVSFRWIMTHDPERRTDWFVGLRAMGSQVVRKKLDFFWNEDFSFQQLIEMKGVTDSYSFIFDVGFISNHDKRTAIELTMGAGTKTYRRRHPGLPGNISPRPLYNFFERGHLLPVWRTVPSYGFNFNFIYRLGVGKSEDQ
jgi:hypothetical protein